MPQRRLIVPDCSVLIPAFFDERLLIGGNEFNLSARARPLEAAIRSRRVRAIAPDVLLSEFLKVALSKVAERSVPTPSELETVRGHILRFLQLPIGTCRGSEVAATAMDLVFSAAISPPDSWYVASAMYFRAELWLSHRHEDGLAAKAEDAGADVHLLSEERFER